MKKAISLILVFVMCLSLCACGQSNVCTCDCPQCAQCEKKTENTELADADPMNNASEDATLNKNVIAFETPIVVAEDENMRVEAVKFYQDYRTLSVHGYPSNADATTEGATLEKYVVFNFCNKTDHGLRIQLDEIYLGSDSAFSATGYQSEEVAAGKNVLREYIIQTGGKETLQSLEELYSLDGDFYVWYVDDNDVGRDRYSLKFSIPNGMSGGNADPVSETADFENSVYLGTWQVTDITFADENISSHLDEDPELWESYFEGVLGAFDGVYLVLSDSGDYHYLNEDVTNTGRWQITETGVKVGKLVLVAEGNKLVSEQDGYLLYWEKVSDSRTVPAK